jgi:RimJ/RimL family protein N-acetyltransferase
MLGPVLETARVRLEPPRPEHLPRFVGWFGDREVTRYLQRRFPPSLRQEERWLEEMAASEADVVWAVVLREAGEVAGVAALHRIDWRARHGWVEITLGERSAWGKGHGTEMARLCTGYAFEELGFEKVLASVYSGNDASLEILKTLGYQQCGLLRRHAYFGGRWHDEWLGEILREEWVTPSGGR